MTLTTAQHPLAPLTADEIDRFRSVLTSLGLVGSSVRFAYVALVEPDKADVRAGLSTDRRVSALLVELATAETREVVVNLATGDLLVDRVLGSGAGHAPTFDADFDLGDAIVKSDAGWVAALAKRGITDLENVRTVSLSAGSFDYADEVGIRVTRVLAFYSQYPSDSVWAHPIDGVLAHVDLTNQRVLRIVETDVTHVPAESGDYLDPAVRGPERTSLKPIEISQPEGVSFTLDDNVLSWENWSVRIGFNGREGLTLHNLAFDDHGVTRSIIDRASISEMVVPYGDPTPTHNWQNYFDVGEYQFGRLANSLELGCDCVGDITYLDAVVANDFGYPTTLKNAICIHEEDYGILWKHSDGFAGTSETRRQRRIVISFFVTVGNYDYGFYWYLYLDGTIQLEAKATGIVFTSGYPGGDYPYANEIAPGLGAPFHQHLFSARLDMAVDGPTNAVEEIDAERVAMGPGNPLGNAFTRTVTRLRTEAEAQRVAASDKARVWAVVNTETTNRMGGHPAYVLYPEGQPTLLAADESSIAKRAAFATKHLWVTRFHEDELWASGAVVNQHPGGGGLPAYAGRGRDIDGTDIVVWHTFGLTHFPRLEDWPIMPVDYAGFTLKPHGFFDRNPTLDVPAVIGGHGGAEADHCAHHG
ncbi:primary-amine oxidase [Agreia pratensis]|uniref:Amine oxidase n=1 Tax=Agreia pratensis TaxID=150121 RepID=A0A1X7L4C1_9MICO|nr:primary-amine oxidase [Agreia pratensis]MBF4635999.1 primary-amine oxidase [Agreia pratensis]SMG48253.1 primary-amine oxidase [Agreia pratensis]